MTSYKRTINTPSLVLYGVGAILGAGIYALVGKVAYFSGSLTPLAFVLAAVTASFTGLSYAELSSRIPRSGGEVAYTRTAFASIDIGNFVGWLVILTGIISAAAMSTGIVGYVLHLMPHIPEPIIILTFISFITLIAVKGMKESIMVITVITIIEMGGLIFVILVGFQHLPALSNLTDYFIPGYNLREWDGLFSGAFLAFYAFIGFEDMVNVADEVVKPQVTIARSITYALVISTTLYILVSLVLVKSMPLTDLSQSRAPLALFFERYTNISPTYISLVSLVAILNGAMIQIIMASRILHAIACNGGAPMAFSKLNPITQTPVKATMASACAILICAEFLPLTYLAQMTSLIILVVFAMVNISLLIMKMRKKKFSPAEIEYPIYIPILGFTSCALLLISQMRELTQVILWLY